MGLETRLRLAKLFVGLSADAGPDRLDELTKAAVAGGSDMIALQPGRASERELTKAYAVVREAAYPDAMVVVMHAADVAKSVGADALLVGIDVRSPVRPHEWGLVGRTVNNMNDFRIAMRDGKVDFVVIGPAFADRDDRQGLELVAAADRLAPADRLTTKPWFVAGGIHEGNINLVLDAGAKRVGVNRGVVLAPNPRAATSKLDEALRRAWTSDPDMGVLSLDALSGGQAIPAGQVRKVTKRKPGCTCTCHDDEQGYWD